MATRMGVAKRRSHQARGFGRCCCSVLRDGRQPWYSFPEHYAVMNATAISAMRSPAMLEGLWCDGLVLTGKFYAGVPGFLPGAFGGIVPEIRQSIPSTGSPSSLNLVTLHRDTSPRAERSDREARTSASGIPVAAAISESIC